MTLANGVISTEGFFTIRPYVGIYTIRYDVTLVDFVNCTESLLPYHYGFMMIIRAFAIIHNAMQHLLVVSIALKVSS